MNWGADTMVRQADGVALTRREREVADLICEGMTAKEIGRRLGISHKTVDRHLVHLRLKTGTRNRSHLAAVMMEAEALAEAS